ncbi:ABC-2 transporter permease [Aggregicoccus sp. 17bor-14]|uniref:ABC transporter permease n=1 Tax=Myxococcaceae TaxID=31 RepID=UPI00129C78D1|nr:MULTISPECIES: ABC transporter permease [Myxococcaceae]MBF5045178.1 ABC-2 transporter permease [Simulacricoccus sp. 17bor-14]MRI90919.1 ABC-2 transporter permease [Aggregicoccus sp. 17bor-14]
MSFPAFRALVAKDLRLFLSDRRSLVISFAVPLALAAFMGFVTGGHGKEGTPRVALLVVDEDGSALSREVVAGLGSDKALAVTRAERAVAREQVRAGKTPVAVVLPARFGEAAGQAFFGGATKPELTLLYDPSHGAEVAMVRGILTQHVMQAVSKSAFSPQVQGGPVRDALARLQQDGKSRPELEQMLKSVLAWQQSEAAQPAGARAEAGPTGGLSVPFEAREEEVTSGEVRYNAYSHSFAGMGVQFVLLAATDAGIGILTERQRGLWRRLRAAPLSRRTLLLSRLVSGALTALMVLLVLFGFGAAVFGVRVEGSLPGFFLVAVGIALMSSAFGLLVAALGHTPQAARGMAIFVVLVMVMLGGAWFPSFLFPAALQKLTLAMPTRWAVDGLDAMTWRGLGLTSALGTTGVLLAFAALFASLALARFRWDAD